MERTRELARLANQVDPLIISYVIMVKVQVPPLIYRHRTITFTYSDSIVKCQISTEPRLPTMPPAPISPKVKEESKPYPASSPSKPKAKSGPGRASEGEKWTPEQLWALFQGIYTRRDSVDWEKVARDVGRPVKVNESMSMSSIR